MSGQELYQKFLESFPSGTAWDDLDPEYKEAWNVLGEHWNESVRDAVAEHQPGTKAGERTDV